MIGYSREKNWVLQKNNWVNTPKAAYLFLCLDQQKVILSKSVFLARTNHSEISCLVPNVD